MKRNKSQWAALILLLAAAGTAVLYSRSFYQWVVPAYGAALALLFLTAAAGTALFGLQKGRTKRSAVVRGLIVGGLYVAVLSALTFLINNVLTGENKPWITALAVTAVNFVLWLCWGLRFFASSSSQGEAACKPGARALAVLLSCCLLLGGCLPLQSALSFNLHHYGKGLAAPTGTGVPGEQKHPLKEDADLYVAPDGSDDNDGSFDHPLATVEKARDLVRKMDRSGRDGIIIALKAGEYSVKHIEFTAEDGGTESCPVVYCACGDGEAVLNGGVTLDPASFTAVTDEAVLSRLTDDAKQRVVCNDLTALGLTAADWGKLYSVGGYSTASHYDGDTTGPVPCVLYFNGAPMTTARYPDTGFLKV